MAAHGLLAADRLTTAGWGQALPLPAVHVSSAVQIIMSCMWAIVGQPETDVHPAGGYDGTWHRWWLERDEERWFVMVKVTRHAEMGFSDRMTTRSRVAVETHGRSEVLRYLEREALPPRIIEVTSIGDPRVIAERQAAHEQASR